MVAENFYVGLLGADDMLDIREAPYSLHHAIRAVRERFSGAPSLWAGYLHVGP